MDFFYLIFKTDGEEKRVKHCFKGSCSRNTRETQVPFVCTPKTSRDGINPSISSSTVPANTVALTSRPISQWPVSARCVRTRRTRVEGLPAVKVSYGARRTLLERLRVAFSKKRAQVAGESASVQIALYKSRHSVNLDVQDSRSWCTLCRDTVAVACGCACKS